MIGALETLGETWHPWHFAGPDEGVRRLGASGFTDVRAWLHDEPTAFEPGAPLEEFLATVVLGAHLQRLAPDQRQPFTRAVAAALPGPVIDYVRLNLVAVRSDG